MNQLFSPLPLFLGFFYLNEGKLLLKSVISAATAANIKYLKILKADFCHISIHQPPCKGFAGIWGDFFEKIFT